MADPGDRDPVHARFLWGGGVIVAFKQHWRRLLWLETSYRFPMKQDLPLQRTTFQPWCF